MPKNLLTTRVIMSVCVLLSLTYNAFAQKVIVADTSHYTTLRIDPFNAMGGNVGDYFEEIEYIPLETINESIFGSIAQLEIIDDNYVILDYNTKSILIFDKTGKFRLKIKGNTKNGIWSFSIDKFSKLIIYYNSADNTIVYCDLNGKQVKTVKLGSKLAKDEIEANNLSYFAPGMSITSGSYSTLDTADKWYKTYSNSLIRYVKDDKTVYAKGLTFTPAEGKIEGVSTGKGPLTTFGNDTVFLYSKPFAYSLYTVTPNTIKYSYKLVFPQSISLPKDFLTAESYTKSRLAYLEKHPNEVFSLNNCFLNGNSLLFEAANVFNYNNKEDCLMYNLKSGTLVAFKHISADERSYHLPIFDPYSYTSGKFIACDDKYLYTTMSALAMFKANENTADKKPQYPAALAKYFKERNRRDNPVIIRLKLKTEY